MFFLVAFGSDYRSFPIASAKLRHFVELAKLFMVFFQFALKKHLIPRVHNYKKDIFQVEFTSTRDMRG